jgi:hypothetical protein
MHRYGRHGAKAWLRWRNKRFHKMHLVTSPRIVVFNMPLEFLTRIQKVVIVMQDGSQLEVEKNVSQAQFNGQSTLSSDERYLRNASRLGQLRAEQDYSTLIDPYEPNYRSDTQGKAYELYFDMEAHGDQFTRWDSEAEAVTAYLDQFDIARFQRLDELTGATTKGTRELVVAAAKDQKKGGNASPEDTPHGVRAIIRAYRSLMADGHVFPEELPDEDMLLIQSRAALYHHRYNQNRSRMAVSSDVASKEVD